MPKKISSNCNTAPNLPPMTSPKKPPPTLTSLPYHILQTIFLHLPSRNHCKTARQAYAHASQTCRTLHQVLSSRGFKTGAFRIEYPSWDVLMPTDSENGTKEHETEETKFMNNVSCVFVDLDPEYDGLPWGTYDRFTFAGIGTKDYVGDRRWISWIIGQNDGVLLELVGKLGVPSGTWSSMKEYGGIRRGKTEYRATTLLLFAALHGLLDVSEKCLDVMQKVVNEDKLYHEVDGERDTSTTIGEDALEMACMGGHHDIVQLLCSRGYAIILPKIQNNQWRPGPLWTRWKSTLSKYFACGAADVQVKCLECLIAGTSKEGFEHVDYLIGHVVGMENVLRGLVEWGEVERRLRERGVVVQSQHMQNEKANPLLHQDTQQPKEQLMKAKSAYENLHNLTLLHLINPPPHLPPYNLCHDIVPAAICAGALEYLSSIKSTVPQDILQYKPRVVQQLWRALYFRKFDARVGQWVEDVIGVVSEAAWKEYYRLKKAGLIVYDENEEQEEDEEVEHSGGCTCGLNLRGTYRHGHACEADDSEEDADEDENDGVSIDEDGDEVVDTEEAAECDGVNGNKDVGEAE